jgi:Bax protein
MDRLEEKTGRDRPRYLAGSLAVLATFALGAGIGAVLHLSGPLPASRAAEAAAPVVIVPVAAAPAPPDFSPPLPAALLPAADAPPALPEAGGNDPVPDPPEGGGLLPAGAEAVEQENFSPGLPAGDDAAQARGTGLLDLIAGPAVAEEPDRNFRDVLAAAAAAVAEIEASEAAARRQTALLAFPPPAPPPALEEPQAPSLAMEDAEDAFPLPPLLPADEVSGSSEPGYLLDQLPAGLSDAVPADIRKTQFVEAILPLVLRVNEEIREERRRVQEIASRDAAGLPAGYRDSAWIARLAERYRLPGALAQGRVDFAALLERVDVVPPSLALAQAAEESGWGTSRLARTRNALFGQTLGRDGGPDGAARFRSFARLVDSIRAYIHNLNSHAAYEGLRARRAAQRRAGRSPDGLALAAGLQAYSERGSDYVSSVREIIRGNLFHRHDLVHPAGDGSRPLLVPANQIIDLP